MSLLLSAIPWYYRLAAIAALGAALWGHGAYFEHGRMVGKVDAAKDALTAFKAQVQANGEAAEKAKLAQESADKARKDKADAQNRTSLATLRADNDRLRNSRAASSFVPSAPAGSASPDRAAFDRAELERALQRLDAGVSGLIESGDEARVSLDTAKAWAQH